MLALALLVAQTPAQAPPQSEFTRESSTFGMVVSGAGDQDGDGIPDLLVGEDHTTYLDAWLLSGKDGSTLRKIQSVWTRDCGVEVLAAPDVDGDRKLELLVCAKPYGRDRSQAAGLVLVSGGSGSNLWHVPVPCPALEHGVHLVHDADGDEVADIGLLHYNDENTALELTILSTRSGAVVRTETIENARQPGKCWFMECPDLDGDARPDFALLEEGPERTPSVVLRAWSTARNQSLWSFEIPRRYTTSSGALALLGDLDGDGTADLAVTIYDEVHVLSGKSGTLLYKLERTRRDDNFVWFGACVLPLGDVDGDGFRDLVLSEPDELWSGNLRAYSGKDGKPLWAISPPSAVDAYHFGYDLAPVGDIDGDGITDLLVGSWEGASAAPGYAALISGKKGVPLLEFRRGASGVIANKPDPKFSWLPPTLNGNGR
jgi:hypothetical protein